MYNLLFPNPGHFHAGLTLRVADPRLNPDIYVYAQEGPELADFLALVEAFNTRAEAPTNWRPHVYTGDDYFTRMIEERKGELVLLAGKNDRKMAEIRALHEAGLHVLADKPWVMGPQSLDDLRAAMTGGPLVMDIMTERHEVTLVMLRQMLASDAVFGGFAATGDTPALEVDTTHQLYKTVNGKVLVRYPWYFDIALQGDGIVDVPTHLVDQVQWLLGGMAGNDGAYDYGRDVELLSARRWATELDAEAYARITREGAFPAGMAGHVRDGLLHCPCNGAINYRLRGVPVRVRSFWGLTTTPTADDYHLVCRGRRAEIVLDHGAHADSGRSVVVRPAPGEAATVRAGLEALVAGWQADYPGTALAGTGIASDGTGEALEVTVPAVHLIGHEEHFSMVLEEFLDFVERGAWPDSLAPDIITKYTLLAQAQQMAEGTEWDDHPEKGGAR